MQIDWEPADKPLAAALLRFIRERGGVHDLPSDERVLKLRKAWLPFYPRLAFVEITDESDSDRKRQLYALLDPDLDAVTVLDMTNQPVYAVNEAGHLRLDTDDEAKRYTAFFFSCVAGPYGLMPVIEKLDLPPEAEADDDMKGTLADLRGKDGVIPPRAERDAENWRVRAALLFQGAVFKTEIVINPKGVVRVDKHELALASGEPEE